MFVAQPCGSLGGSAEFWLASLFIIISEGLSEKYIVGTFLSNSHSRVFWSNIFLLGWIVTFPNQGWEKQVKGLHTTSTLHLWMVSTSDWEVSQGNCSRGEREWLLNIWEREWEWLNPFPNFGNGNGNDKLHSQPLGTGTGMKIPFPIFGNGNGNSIPEFWEREWDVVIPGNDREWEREWHRKI